MPVDVTTSILLSTKKALGLDAEYTAFDPDITMHINAVFDDLGQLGLNQQGNFMIEDKEDTWASYFGDRPVINSVKSYMYLRVRLLFDPPATSFALDAISKQISQMEWRINVAAENADLEAKFTTPVVVEDDDG